MATSPLTFGSNSQSSSPVAALNASTAPRARGVHDAVNHDRRRLLAPMCIEVIKPREPQPIDVVGVAMSERTEPRLAIIPADARDSFGWLRWPTFLMKQEISSQCAGGGLGRTRTKAGPDQHFTGSRPSARADTAPATARTAVGKHDESDSDRRIPIHRQSA